jgi:hypothetical protein
VASLRDKYQERLEARQAIAVRLDRLHASSWWARLAASLSLALVMVLAAHAVLHSAWVLVAVMALAVTYLAEGALSRGRDRARRAVAFYEAAVARLEGRWVTPPFTGAEFVPANHPSAPDLDLVGERSLFARVNTARTRVGAGTLASWLLEPADESTLRGRHMAAAELQGRLDLREALHLAGPTGVAHVDRDVAVAWGHGAGYLPWPWLRWPLLAVAWTLVVAALGAALGWWGLAPLAGAAAAVVIVHVAARKRASAAAIEVLEPLRQLSIVAGIMAIIEREPFTDPLLKKLQDVLLDGGRASSSIRELDRTIRSLLALKFELVGAVGFPLLWPVRKALDVESWRQLHGHRIDAWLTAVGTFEALCSISTYSDENPDHRYAEVVDEGPVFEAEGLGHPLLPRANSVTNDIRLGADGASLLLLSGSNMSGKSTLIRAVGLNAAMALAGLPVRAQRLKLSRMAIGTSIRVHDSVVEGESRFYAEIKRLRSIVELASGSTPLLFLLDELLSGTNSHDRLAGASGVLAGLVARGAIGICSTHDLALTGIADQLGSRAMNAHFGDQMNGGRLVFDYKLKPGVVRHSNALELMREVGLSV